MSSAGDFDVIVAGGGPAGLVAACLAAEHGLRTALVTGPRDGRSDRRTVALMTPALALLERCQVWPHPLSASSAPLRKLRLVDDTGSFAAAPELVFAAREAGMDAFGWNIPLAALAPALEQHLLAGGVAVRQASVAGLSCEAAQASLSLDDGTALKARVVLAADGRNSRLRNALGIETVAWSYEQAAIALSFGHSRPHRDVSNEYHKPAGPFTTVPLPGDRSSLVWMERPERAAELMALDDRSLAGEIQALTHGELGLISDPGPRQSFAMSGLRATRFAKDRVMLMGEAAHIVPPIGAQGLNMSFRDASDAIDLVVRARDKGNDPGADNVLADYDRLRQRDVRPRQAVIDLMNRSLLSGFLPMEAGRAAGLAALGAFGPLRRYAMSMGLGSPSRSG